jgi:uncharacterized PurR-regulated membrane protein YhhQ (DUF165 family)
MIRNLFSAAILGYIASVVLLNVGFAYVPMVDTPIGMLSPMAVLAGLVFVLRDFAQRKAEHGVLIAMAIATVLSYFLADPFVAMASAAAFAVAEIVDYGVYTFSKHKAFHNRILLSSIISTPVDTVVFLYGISAFTVGTFALMVGAKLVAAVAIWTVYAYKDGAADPWDDTDYDHSASSPFNGMAFRVPLEGQPRKDSPAQPVPRSF